VLSYWPSLGLLAVFLVIVLECRAIGARVTLPLGSLLVLFCYGCIGAPLLAVLVQQLPVLGGFDAASMAWLTGPPLEELAKAVPVIVLAFLTRESRRLSIADLTVVGFASGAGFGFVEANLKMIVDGTLPDLGYFLAFGLQVAPSSAADGSVYFAGHAVSTGLVGLAAGIGLHILQLHRFYVWLPSAFVVVWASFDHGMYNWKVLHADASGAFQQAHFLAELLHRATLHGQLATWTLACGLVAAQIVESYLCAKAVGRRRDLLLALEWRPWVINEWFVALMRVPFGRGALARTLAYFRLRRAFFLATLQAKRDSGDVTLNRHARSLEDRLKRERALVFDPPSGTWFLPFPVLSRSAAQWAWHMRWVLLFATLLFMLFMLDPATLPGWLRQLLFGDIFTKIVLIGGLAFAIWKIILFSRSAPPDPLAAEGAAFANYYTRELLLGCSLLCGLFPTLALLFGWNAIAPGAAFLSGYLPGWIGQGGNLQTLLGLGAFGGAVAPDPRPAGDALRHEIAAGDERIRRLAFDLEGHVGDRGESAGAPTLEQFLGAMERLDAERDAQARRQLAFAEFQRQAADSLAKDPAPVVEAVKEEFDRLASELLEAAAKELDAIAALEQAYAKAWSKIMRDLDQHDALRDKMKGALRQAWENDPAWALRVVEGTDESLLPMQVALLPELQALLRTSSSAHTRTIAAGIERIGDAATALTSAKPAAFSIGTEDIAESEETPLVELGASEEIASDAPVAFDSSEAPTVPERQPEAEAEAEADVASPPDHEPESEPEVEAAKPDIESPKAETVAAPETRGEGYQQAVDRFIDAMQRDTGYIETIRRLERSHEAIQQPVEPGPQPTEAPKPPSDEAPSADAQQNTSLPPAPPLDPEVESETPSPKKQARTGEGLEDIIAAIKRDSGYLDFVQKPRAPAQDVHSGPSPAAEAPETEKTRSGPTTEAPASASTPDEQLSLKELAADDEPAVKLPTEPAVAAIVAVEPEQPVVEAPQHQDDSVAATEAVVTQSPELSAMLAQDEPYEETPAPHAVAEAKVSQPEPEIPAAASEPDHPVAQTPSDPASEYTSPETVARAPELLGESTSPIEESTTSGAVAEITPPAAIEPETHAPASEPVSDRGVDHVATEPTPSRDSTSPESIGVAPASVEPLAPDEKRPARVKKWFGGVKLDSGDRRMPFKRDDQPAQPLELSKADVPPAEKPQVTAPSAETPSAAPPVRVPEPSQGSGEPAGPQSKDAWLADFAAAMSEDGKAKTDSESPLQSIQWPTLNELGLSQHQADTPPAESPSIPETTAPTTATAPEAAQPQPTKAEADAPVAPAADTLAAEATKDKVADAKPVEAAPAPVKPTITLVRRARPSKKPVESAPAPTETEPPTIAVVQPVPAVETPETEAPEARTAESAPASAQQTPVETPPATNLTKPAAIEDTQEHPRSSETVPDQAATVVAETQTADEAPSKADRLTDLFAKLEKAMQAKSAPESAPAAEDPAPIASNRAPAAHEPPKPVERAIETRATPVEPTPTALAPTPGDLKESDQLKPDRLSFLLTKLFEAVKRESVEEAAKPEPVAEDDARPSTADASTAEDILNLRTAKPSANVDSEPSSSVDSEPGSEPATPISDASAEPNSIASVEPEPSVNPTEIPAASDAAPADAKPAELPEPAATTHADQPTAELPESSSKAPAEPDPIVAPSQAKPIARQAAASGTFGTRRKPPATLQTLLSETKGWSAPDPAEARTQTSAKHGAAPAGQSERPPEAKPSRTEPRTPQLTSKPDRVKDQPQARAAAATTSETKSEATFRAKGASGALAVVESLPGGATAEKMPVKYYGPKHVEGGDEGAAAKAAHQRATNLAEALAEYYAKSGETQPPMHTTDRATLQRVIQAGKLEAPRRRGAPWSMSGMARRGEVVIRLKPGAEKFVEFVPSKESFGQVPHFYSRGVGKGSFVTYVPAAHLEFFDPSAGLWVAMERGRV
jgi:RsiW-degrading membrane proteinase PrsW (M82 family)